MGRYITGDIEHKFWFGTQPSDAALQFGGERLVTYCYNGVDDFDIDQLNELLEYVNKKYRTNFVLTTDPEILYDDLSDTFSWKEVQNDCLVADLQLGLRIYQHILEHGYCEFEAET